MQFPKTGQSANYKLNSNSIKKVQCENFCSIRCTAFEFILIQTFYLHRAVPENLFSFGNIFHPYLQVKINITIARY